MLSYKCSASCRHCMYVCSEKWQADWISEQDVKDVLSQLSGKIKPSPNGPDKVGVNHGFHFTGGEPFLNFHLLLRSTEIAHEMQIPSTFVETNCHWCTDDKTTKERLERLRDAGLHGLMISVNPFILEHVPFERTERAFRIGREVFKENTMVYQEVFYRQFKDLRIEDTLSLEAYLEKAGWQGLYYAELIPMGRLPYELGHLFKKYPASQFFDDSCREELTRNWHVHVDNYGNYMTGFCGGISLGGIRDLDSICKGIDLAEYPILDALITKMEKFYELSQGLGYEELKDGYVSKCHLCIDIRKYLTGNTEDFKELAPLQFYSHL